MKYFYGFVQNKNTSIPTPGWAGRPWDERGACARRESSNSWKSGKAALEQLQLINELNEKEKGILLKLIEIFVSKKRFKDYFQKNIAAL